MDDIESELPILRANSKDTSEDEINQTRKKRTKLLRVSLTMGHPKETGFHKTTRLCLRAIKDAMLHHRWQEAAQYLDVYTQTLEDTTTSKQLSACGIIWRLGTEVLQHHPNAELEHFNVLYERMKNTGVKNYAKICLEHAFHLLSNGQVPNAKQQLAVALSWRYGQHSVRQTADLKLIQAYCGFLDYLVWATKRSSVSDAEDCESSREMHSYFRQASVTLQEIIKQPGVWDPFVLACVDMLEFYNDEETALELLQNYAYNTNNPSNPNASVYLYEYQKRHGASSAQLISTLKVLHSLVPSHELMLEYCSLLMKSGEQKHLQLALSILMNLLEHAGWRSEVKAWRCLLKVLKRLRNKNLQSEVKEQWEGRRELWLKMHFKTFHSRKDATERPELLYLKSRVMQHFGLYNRRYNKRYLQEEKELSSEEDDILKVRY